MKCEGRFTHSICDSCWDRRNKGIPHEPVRMIHPDTETCCYCGTQHASGIYVRDNPEGLKCGR